MSEPGWSLIPRELLPVPVTPAPNRSSSPPSGRAASRSASPAASRSAAGGRQLAMFAAETLEPSPADLAGLLAGTGRLDRMGGTARVRVPVDAAWRVHVLVDELVQRGLVVSWRSAADRAPSNSHGLPDGSDHATVDEEDQDCAYEVRTAYSSRLSALARGWPQLADQLFLSGPRLRLWVAAAGGPLDGAYALGRDPARESAAVDAALIRAGLAARVSDDGRHYLISGRRRLSRLAELVGERPVRAPAALWPGGIPA